MLTYKRPIAIVLLLLSLIWAHFELFNPKNEWYKLAPYFGEPQQFISYVDTGGTECYDIKLSNEQIAQWEHMISQAQIPLSKTEDGFNTEAPFALLHPTADPIYIESINLVLPSAGEVYHDDYPRLWVHYSLNKTENCKTIQIQYQESGESPLDSAYEIFQLLALCTFPALIAILILIPQGRARDLAGLAIIWGLVVILSCGSSFGLEHKSSSNFANIDVALSLTITCGFTNIIIWSIVYFIREQSLRRQSKIESLNMSEYQEFITSVNELRAQYDADNSLRQTYSREAAAIIEELRSAFMGVSCLNERHVLLCGEGLDEYLPADTLDKLATQEIRNDWESIPYSLLSACGCSLSYVGPEAYRFLLPAFIKEYILTEDCYGIDLIIRLTHQNTEDEYLESHLEQYKLFNKAQRDVVTRFINHYRRVSFLHTNRIDEKSLLPWECIELRELYPALQNKDYLQLKYPANYDSSGAAGFLADINERHKLYREESPIIDPIPEELAAIIEKVQSAFKGVSCLSEPHLLYCCAAIAAGIDPDELIDIEQRQNWESICSCLISLCKEAIPHLGPEAFRFLLPAIIKTELCNSESVWSLELTTRLCIDQEQEATSLDSMLEQTSLLSDAQRTVTTLAINYLRTSVYLDDEFSTGLLPWECLDRREHYPNLSNKEYLLSKYPKN